jgi:hypothetical protein
MSDEAGPTGVLIDVDEWKAVRDAMEGPWPTRLAEIDLAFIELETGAVPPRRKLMKRWGITERKARTIVQRYKAKRPKLITGPSQEHTAEDSQVTEITAVDESTPSQVNVVSVPKISDIFTENIRVVFDAWEVAQFQRTRRRNKLTAGRRKIIRAALKGGHTVDDLVLVVRMAFEYPEGDYLVDGWRSGGYMDIANLLNRDKVDRNVTVASERWNGNEWVFSGKKQHSFETKYHKLWEKIVFLVGAYPTKPDSLHRVESVDAAMHKALDVVGGWRYLGSLRPGKQQEQIKNDFLSEVRSELQQQRPTLQRGNHK